MDYSLKNKRVFVSMKAQGETEFLTGANLRRAEKVCQYIIDNFYAHAVAPRAALLDMMDESSPDLIGLGEALVQKYLEICDALVFMEGPLTADIVKDIKAAAKIGIPIIQLSCKGDGLVLAEPDWKSLDMEFDELPV